MLKIRRAMYYKIFVTEGNAKQNKEIFSRKETIKITEVADEKTNHRLPRPRQFKSIQINFTPRHFSTPSRESTKADEQEVTVLTCYFFVFFFY